MSFQTCCQHIKCCAGISGGQTVLPVWYGEWGVPEDRGAQPVSVHLSHEVPTPGLEDHSSIHSG